MFIFLILNLYSSGHYISGSICGIFFKACFSLVSHLVVKSLGASQLVSCMLPASGSKGLPSEDVNGIG